MLSLVASHVAPLHLFAAMPTAFGNCGGSWTTNVSPSTGTTTTALTTARSRGSPFGHRRFTFHPADAGKAKWRSQEVANQPLVKGPTQRIPGFHLPLISALNRSHASRARCGRLLHGENIGDSPVCSCGHGAQSDSAPGSQIRRRRPSASLRGSRRGSLAAPPEGKISCCSPLRPPHEEEGEEEKGGSRPPFLQASSPTARPGVQVAWGLSQLQTGPGQVSLVPRLHHGWGAGLPPLRRKRNRTSRMVLGP